MTTTTAPSVTVTPSDRAAWESWVASLVEYVEQTLRIDVWDHAARARAGKPAAWTADAWVGPWWTVKPYVTTEFREAVEQGLVPRQTVTQYARAQVQARADLAVMTEEAADGHALDQLAYIRALNEDRDRYIVEASASGATVRAICEASGLSRSQVMKIRADAATAARLQAALDDALAAEYADADEPF
jgi:hypothetical protein